MQEGRNSAVTEFEEDCEGSSSSEWTDDERNLAESVSECESSSGSGSDEESTFWDVDLRDQEGYPWGQQPQQQPGPSDWYGYGRR